MCVVLSSFSLLPGRLCASRVTCPAESTAKNINLGDNIAYKDIFCAPKVVTACNKGLAYKLEVFWC